jgi:hypothetical protein
VLSRPALLASCALAVIAIWEIAVMARSKSAAPTDADWQAAAKLVDSEWQDGDLVVFAPAWVDPVGRRWLGHRLTLADAGRMDAEHYTRIWELSIRGAWAPELGHWDEAELERDFGAVHVRRKKQPGATVTWRLHEGAPVTEVDFRPRQCMRISGARTFRAAPLGEKLVVYAGLADVWARKENKAFAHVRVRVDGKDVGTAQLGNDSGWVKLVDVAVTPGAHDVSIDVQPDPRLGDPKKARLETCLAAESRTPVPWAR